MSRHRPGIFVISLAVLGFGVGTAVATPPKGVTRTDLGRSTIAEPITAKATEASDLVMHKVTFEPGATNGWHSHPGPVFVTVKSGSFTLHKGDASGCTAQTFTTGQGFFEPPNAVHLGRNEGSEPFEGLVTYLAVPVGGELFKTEANPGGADCPSVSASATGIARTDLARAAVAEPISVDAKEASDMAIQTLAWEPDSTGGWHHHPAATFVAVKSGTLTLYHGDANGCTSQTYTAGQGFLEPADDVHVNRNEGSTPVELYVTFLAAPVGAALRVDEQNPGGANCPDPNPVEQTALEGASQLPRTGAAGPAGLLAALGVGLAAAGITTCVVARRR